MASFREICQKGNICTIPFLCFSYVKQEVKLWAWVIVNKNKRKRKEKKKGENIEAFRGDGNGRERERERGELCETGECA
jgi:hypothetical protein